MRKDEVIAVFSEIWWQASRGECTFLSQHEHGEELPVWLARIEAAQEGAPRMARAWTCVACQSTNLASDMECGYCDTPRREDDIITTK